MKSRKKYILTITITLFTCFLFAQDVGDLVRLKVQIPVISVESIIDGKDKGKSFNVIGGSTKFMVISKSDSEVALQAPNYKPFSQEELEKYRNENGGKERLDYSEFYNEKIYTVSKSDFDLSAVSIEEKKRISIGILSLPFKARPQDSFSFDTKFNLNTTLNIALWHLGDYSLNGQFGAGIGSVSLNSNNAPGLMEDQDQDIATLTFLSGIMLSHNNVQVGLYIGVDQINNQDTYQWDDNGNLWFAFGIGYDLFNIASANKKNKQ